MNTKNRQGEVKVVNALASIHQILDEIAPEGKLHCKMQVSESDAQFIFTNNGIEATFHIQKGGVR